MTVELERRDDIDLAAVERAWPGAARPWRSRPRRASAWRRAAPASCACSTTPTWSSTGVTSGYGQAAGVRFAPGRSAAATRRARPWQSAASFGEPLPARVTRAIVLARLANYLEGHAAISPGLAAAVAALLDAGELPAVPAEGNGGAGEILALSALFAPLAARHELGEKDALALINGSPCAAALAGDAAIAARRRLAAVEEVFALAFEALQAPLEHLDPALEALWGDPDEAAALASLRALLEGAEPRAPGLPGAGQLPHPAAHARAPAPRAAPGGRGGHHLAARGDRQPGLSAARRRPSPRARALQWRLPQRARLAGDGRARGRLR
ncbi:MAG: aromatic amino acid lyase [Halofilum sp. (in: g-proteobacteria)]|nr:aromatic amino acid lyase [Halofilum sp. (in: g-proteobacteria)]